MEQVGTNFNFKMPVDEIIEFALQSVGGDHISGKESSMARTALNLVFIDLQNRGMAPLSSLELLEISLASGSSMNYSLGESNFAVLNGVIKTSTTAGYTDLRIEKDSYSDWLEIPTKESTHSRPTRYFVDRQSTDTLVSFWPVPDKSNYSFKVWALKKIANVDRAYQLPDIPSRYLPAIIAGLKFYMADLRGLDVQTKMYMKQEYLELLQTALDEDRERVNLRIYPDVPRVY